MNALGLAAIVPMLLLAAMLWVTPAVTRPTLQFGVRVPPERVWQVYRLRVFPGLMPALPALVGGLPW